jgi:CBS domain-containing protein
MKTTVKEVLDQKGREIYSIRSDAPVKEALKKMQLKEIGALMVIDDGKLVGIFSERDYVRKILKENLNDSMLVKDFMSTKLVAVNSNTTISECMALMTQKKIRHLPVIDNNVIGGLISIGDVVNTIIQQQHLTIKDLEKYILGGYGTE